MVKFGDGGSYCFTNIGPCFQKHYPFLGRLQLDEVNFFIVRKCLADFEWQILCKDCTSPTAWNSFRSKRGIRRKVGCEVCGSSLRYPVCVSPKLHDMPSFSMPITSAMPSDHLIYLNYSSNIFKNQKCDNYPHTHEEDYSSITLITI